MAFVKLQYLSLVLCRPVSSQFSLLLEAISPPTLNLRVNNINLLFFSLMGKAERGRRERKRQIARGIKRNTKRGYEEKRKKRHITGKKWGLTGMGSFL